MIEASAQQYASNFPKLKRPTHVRSFKDLAKPRLLDLTVLRRCKKKVPIFRLFETISNEEAFTKAVEAQLPKTMRHLLTGGFDAYQSILFEEELNAVEYIVAKGHELGTLEVVQMLLREGAPPCSVHYAMKSSQTKHKTFPNLIELLVERGATIDYPDKPFIEFFAVSLTTKNQFVWRCFPKILEHCLIDIK